MHGNHHHHQRTDFGGIMSITSVLGHLCHAFPLQNPKYATDVNMPSQTNYGTWVEKHQRFLFNVYIVF